MSEERRQRILDAINKRLKGNAGSIDPLALATEIDAALGADTLEAGANPASARAARRGRPDPGSSPKGVYAEADEGKKPDELNASNDD